MSEAVTLHFPFPPIGKGRPRISTRHGFVRNITPQTTRKYEKDLSESARVQLGMRFEPWIGPVDLEVFFYMPIPKSLSKKKREAMRAEWHIVKPDTSNLLKAVEDALNGILWVDDSQVARCTLSKTYGAEPGIHINAKRI